MKIGLQLYTLREAAAQNFEETLQKVSEQGYEGVELAGFFGHSVKEVKGMLEKYHLIPISAHVSMEELEENLEKVISDYQTIGCDTIVLPYLVEECRYGNKTYENLVKKMEEIGHILLKKGMKFAYHNHDFEFCKTIDSKYVLDELYEQIPAEYLQAELDTCWISVAGESAEDYIRKYQNRCELIHIKDFKKKEEIILKALGKGEMNLSAVLEAAKECQIKWLIVEQDAHYEEDPFSNTQISIQYVKEYLKK